MSNMTPKAHACACGKQAAHIAHYEAEETATMHALEADMYSCECGLFTLVGTTRGVVSDIIDRTWR